jgi:hypothetical protein
MATVITRNVASTPHRTAAETWEVITKILAPDADSSGRGELQKIAGVAAASIASEAPVNDGFVVFGNGPQVRVYCVFGDDAISGDGINEEPLNEPAAEGEWRMSLPCLVEDLEWTKKKLKELSPRISARAVGESVDYDKATPSRGSAVVLNINEFLKP